MPIKTIRRYAQLVSAGPGHEQERLALLEAHHADVTAKLAEIRPASPDSAQISVPPATPVTSVPSAMNANHDDGASLLP
jgi:DNA-binding transcriptional MerR regulator